MTNQTFFSRLVWASALFSLPFFGTPAAGQTGISGDSLFLFSNTAYTLPVRTGGFALLHNARYAVSRRVELGFHPLAMFLTPDIEVKWKHLESGRYTLSTWHSVSYPSPLLRTVQISGAGGFISPEFDIPDIFAIQNGLLVSTTLGGRHHLTGRAIFEFALNTSALDNRTTIDLPIVFPRSAVFYEGYGFAAGLSAEGSLFGRFSYLADTDAWFFPSGGMDFFSENTLGLIWRTGKKFKLMAGGKLTYGEYPFGAQWHLLPVVDFRWFLRI
ncbi:MAG: hypothetical protein JNJ90_04075 [Saprospiraceae bacterium]|jgi:hypothetical protein|nr:hypothetical protein [Saprospiraceae bacterium]